MLLLPKLRARCQDIICGPDQKVVDYACEACPAGKTSSGNHSASGGDTACDATSCGPDENVVDHHCKACPAGKTSSGSHDASGSDTTCEASSFLLYVSTEFSWGSDLNSVS